VTPAVDIVFAPRVVVAVNPQSLPPLSYVQFDAYPVNAELASIQTPVTSDVLVHIQGLGIESFADPMLVPYTYQADVQIHENVVPPSATGGPGTFTATIQLVGTANYSTGSNRIHAVWSDNLGVKWQYNSATSPASVSCAGLQETFLQESILITPTGPTGGPVWGENVTVNTALNGNCGAPSLQDQIHAKLAPMTAAGLGPATIIDAVFAGTGTAVFNPSVDIDTTGTAILRLFVAHSGTTGQLKETITLPPASPSSPPATDTFTFSLDFDNQFDELAVIVEGG
jgi:hypothetical protein